MSARKGPSLLFYFVLFYKFSSRDKRDERKAWERLFFFCKSWNVSIYYRIMSKSVSKQVRCEGVEFMCISQDKAVCSIRVLLLRWHWTSTFYKRVGYFYIMFFNNTVSYIHQQVRTTRYKPCMSLRELLHVSAPIWHPLSVTDTNECNQQRINSTAETDMLVLLLICICKAQRGAPRCRNM